MNLDELSGDSAFHSHLKYVHSIGCHSNSFFGGETLEGGYHLQQNPYEMAALLTFLTRRLKPEGYTYLEVGSASGGFIRAIYERIPFKSGVMIDNGDYMFEHQAPNIAAFRGLVTRHTLDSHGEQAKEAIYGKKFDVIFVDGDHSYEGVKADIDLVMPHAHRDTLIIFHDIECEHVPGVRKAYEETLKQGRLVEIAKFLKPREVDHQFGIGITIKA